MSQPPPGQIRLTPLADADLDEIWDYLSQNLSEDFAESYLLKLELQLELLLSQPMMGRSAEELRKGLRRFPFQNHVVFYEPMSNGIEVIRVLHQAQDIDRAFQK